MATCRPRPLRTAWILIFVVLGPFPAHAQSENEEPPPPRDAPYTVTLSKVIAQPESEAAVSVLFGQKIGAPRVGALRIRVGYPSAILQFARLEDAYMSRRAKLALHAEQTAHGSQTQLEMRFEIPASVSEFPSGQIATLYLKVPSGVQDQTVLLEPEVWIDGEKIPPDSPNVLIESGAVRISENPVTVGCFFFSH